MDVLRQDQVTQRISRVYAYPVVTAAAWLILWFALMVACFWIGIQGGVRFQGGNVPGFLGYWAGAWFAALCLLQAGDLRARLRGSNWLVKICADGLLIRYRSYRNHHFPESEPTILVLSFEDIEWARGSIREETTPGSWREAGQLRRRKTIELKLSVADQSLGTLEMALSADRERKYRFRHNHFPVRLTTGALLEIDWEVRPAMDIFLAELRGRIPVRESVAEEVDFTRMTKLDSARQRELLARLVMQGDTISAVKMVRNVYGLDLVQAKAFVDKLTADPALRGRR